MNFQPLQKNADRHIGNYVLKMLFILSSDNADLSLPTNLLHSTVQTIFVTLRQKYM